ncbi:tRNA/rRNA methyltransferase (SpoU) [Halothece sp. PCC 7418]|uniref:TrmH family RNA methyltransferase n=1 Tax=Halothece sp. (strain PCC 7418) TaxID=65093 RepID=UPI0002A07F4B|nr:RNA methyltransferase [Halothece sp. PCC 7418]AFZ44834.1 tRNA/rRNA methyltransferase (SpoU) [Halothece sp. PCC 7418]
MLTSIKNPLIKRIRKLHQGKYRKAENVLLLEGTNLLEAACEMNYPLEVVCYTAHWQEKHPELRVKLQQQAQRIELVSPEVLSAIALTKTPDGISAIAPRKSLNPVDLSSIQFGLLVEQLQDPGNMGTIIRTAAATGVDYLGATTDSVEFDHPKVLRASVGAWFRVPMAVETDVKSLLAQFSGQVVATLPNAEKTYWDVDFQQPTLILLGNEGAGLSSELAALADELVQIPLAEGVESLNVAIAASVLLYEAKRQRWGV